MAANIKKVFKKKVITNFITLLSSYEGFVKELPILKSYDIILVDIGLNDWWNKNWLDIIELVRSKNIQIPIVVISWYNDIHYIDHAFRVWASDYLSKPFRLKELEIRVMRWFKSYCMSIMFSHTETIDYKKLAYNFNQNEFYFHKDKISLTKKSKFILFQLLIKSEQLVYESDLADKLWWDIESIKERNVRVNILRLKKSLEPYWISQRILNTRWEWYMLKKK